MPIVSFEPNGKEYQVNSGETIFDAVDNHGHTLAHGCLSGSCGVCKIEILKGVENLSVASHVEQNTIDALHQADQGENLTGKTIRLACRAKVQGDITIRPL